MLATMKYLQPLLRAASTGAAAAISAGGGFPQNQMAFTESRRYCLTPRSRISHTCSSPMALAISVPRLHNQQQHPCEKSNKIGPFVALFSTKSSSCSDTTIQPESELPPSENQEFASSYHAPVMYKECIDAMLKHSHNYTSKKNKYKKLSKVAKQEADRRRGESTETADDPNRPKIYVDGTLGGGGHSLCLLQNLSPGDILIGCDVDPSALATASTRLKDYIVSEGGDGDGDNHHDGEKPIFIPVQSNFRDLYDNVQDLRHPVSGELLLHRKGSDGETSFVGADAILLDLGVSSHQIDNADRGFAYMKDGPLDMRMWGGEWNNQDGNGNGGEGASGFDFVRNKNNVGGGMTAADICNQFEEEEIRRILQVYGDEPRAKRIAGSIVDARPLSTTDDLRKAVAKVTPAFAKKGRRMGRTATLARVFQALRIVVNEEDIVLRDALEIMAPSLIRKGGRLVVLSYHSMEDRAAKRVMRDGSISGSKRAGSSIQKDMFGNEISSGDGTTRPWKPLGKRIKATEAEIDVNSRARSAMLRVAERL